MFFVWIFIYMKLPILIIPGLLGWLGEVEREAALISAIITVVMTVIMIIIFIIYFAAS